MKSVSTHHVSSATLNPKTLVDQARLIAELRAAFPGLPARPLADWGASLGQVGVWTGGGEAVMPDGLPVFTDVLCSDEYDGFVHTAFTQWLDLRGWYIESEDPLTHLIVPDPAIARAVDRLHSAWFAPARDALADNELPF